MSIMGPLVIKHVVAFMGISLQILFFIFIYIYIHIYMCDDVVGCDKQGRMRI